MSVEVCKWRRDGDCGGDMKTTNRRKVSAKRDGERFGVRTSKLRERVKGSEGKVE